MAQRQQNFVRNYRTGVTRILEARSWLKALREEYVALGMDDPVNADAITEADITAVFGSGVSLQQFKDAMSSMNAIDTFIAENFHGTSLYRLKEG